MQYCLDKDTYVLVEFGIYLARTAQWPEEMHVGPGVVALSNRSAGVPTCTHPFSSGWYLFWCLLE